MFDCEMLYGMLSDLSLHKRDRVSVLYSCIDDRLSKSLKVYYDELYYSMYYLLNKKNDLRILRELNKINGV